MVSICKLILIIGFMYIIYICTIADKKPHTVTTNYYSVSDDNYLNTCTVRLCNNEDHVQSRLLRNRMGFEETTV
jgi:hypothetical protein